MWSEKHRPRSSRDLVGNVEARAKLSSWLAKWKPRGKAALLVGPPGTGKTTTVHLLAAEKGMNLVELNASDTRTKKGLEARLGEVLGSTSLFGERSLVFLDEVDGLSGRSDFGAIEFIRDAVKKSENPVVMAANDPESDQVRTLSPVATVVRFALPSPEEVEGLLRRVAEEEGASADEEQLAKIAGAARGDLRYALNALQSGAAGFKEVDATEAGAIEAFFGAEDVKGMMAALRSFPGQPFDKLRALSASVTKAGLPPEKEAAALRVLSDADVLLGRMVSGGDWRLLRYFDRTIATGMAEALGGLRVRYSQDSVPWPLQVRIWNDSKKLKEIARLTGRRMGISRKGAMVEDLPYIMLLCSSAAFREELVRSLGLDEPYAAFVQKESARRRR